MAYCLKMEDSSNLDLDSSSNAHHFYNSSENFNSFSTIILQIISATWNVLYFLIIHQLTMQPIYMDASTQFVGTQQQHAWRLVAGMSSASI